MREGHAQAPRQSLGHYRLLELIGAGGMGQVFRAFDEHLERDVAIKLLSPGAFGDESARRRFRKEALALSRLNHPNVATVYDFDTEAGMDYLAIEFIQGSTLRDLVSAGPMPEKQVVRFGMQLADGLAAAHENGVVHRDLKPENLKITPDGRLKILDFGLAVVVEPSMSGSTTATTGMRAAGTLPYMAPEQLRHEELDPRVDIWAAGAVLYEMATGRPPFPQAGPLLIDAILNRETKPPSQINRAISPVLEWVITKCLEKDRNSRYQSSKELLIDLQKLGTVSAAAGAAKPKTARSATSPRPGARTRRRATAASRRSKPRTQSRASALQAIIVLPLQDLSPAASEEYFADGMTDALISALARIRSLRVISRTSAMRYKGTQKSLPEIAAEVAADAVVEGSVYRAAGRVRITVQLVDAATDCHLWAETYERSLSDVLLLQSDVARAIAEKVRVELSPVEKDHLAQQKPVNSEAYDLYLKGMFHWYKLSREHQDIAKDYFQLALQKDPNLAAAYAGLAQVWTLSADAGFVRPRDAYPQAKEAASKALELDETLPDTHVALGFCRSAEYDWPAAETEFKRAIELDPNSVHARFMYCDFLISMRRFEESRHHLDEVFRLDPFNSVYRCFQSWHLLYQGRYEEAIAEAQKVIATEPNLAAARLALWGGSFACGRYGEAVAAARSFYSLLHDSDIVNVLPAASQKDEYERVMADAARVLVDRSAKTYVPCIRVARFFAHAADPDHALEWLEKARRNQESTLLHLSVGWDWVPLYGDPRFRELLTALNLPLYEPGI